MEKPSQEILDATSKFTCSKIISCLEAIPATSEARKTKLYVDLGVGGLLETYVIDTCTLEIKRNIHKVVQTEDNEEYPDLESIQVDTEPKPKSSRCGILKRILKGIFLTCLALNILYLVWTFLLLKNGKLCRLPVDEDLLFLEGYYPQEGTTCTQLQEFVTESVEAYWDWRSDQNFNK